MSCRLLLLQMLLLLALAAAEKLSTPEGLEFLTKNARKAGVEVLPSGLQYKVLIPSTNLGGVKPNSSSMCHVHYRGTTIKGMEFDSSHKRGKPTKFRPTDVIKGWSEALQLMKEGDKWQVVVPAELAYGKRSMGEHISPGSVLVFEMELVQVEDDSQKGIWNTLLGLIPKFVRDLPYALWAMLGYFLYQLITPSASGPRVTIGAVLGDKRNDRVFMDVKIGDAEPERLEYELFTAHAPKTAANFLHLCLGDKGTGGSGKPMHFKNSVFHRVIPNFMAQGGDFTQGNGRGGESIYGTKFADEWTNGIIGHTDPYLLSMANAGANTNGSQFFLTFVPCSWLDGKHVVFGKLVAGAAVMDKLQAVGSSSGSTRVKVVVTDCGVVMRGEPGVTAAAAAVPAQKEGDKKKD